jgi:hypothetical protein
LIGYFEKNKIFDISLISHPKSDATDMPTPLWMGSPADSLNLTPTSVLSQAPIPPTPMQFSYQESTRNSGWMKRNSKKED